MRRTHPFPIIPIYGPRTGPPREASRLPRETWSDFKRMPQIPIIMPQLGESIAEATVVRLLVQPGDQVETDQDVLEVETNKATMNVASPCSGSVQQLLVKLNESYPVGAVLGYLEVNAENATRMGLDQPAGAPAKPELTNDTEHKALADGKRRGVQPTVRGLPVPANASGASYMSPRMKARMAELGLRAADLSGIAGSGAAGRVAVADAMRRSWTRPIAMVALPFCLDPMLEHRKTFAHRPGPALFALRALAV